jgi:hypothetical protein
VEGTLSSAEDHDTVIAAKVHLTGRADNNLEGGDRDVTRAGRDSHDVAILSYTYKEIDPLQLRMI